MILYCWRDGAIGYGRGLPEGAIELARGGKGAVCWLFRRVAEDGRAGPRPALPCLAQAPDEATALERLRDLLARLDDDQAQARGIVFNRALDLRFHGIG